MDENMSKINQDKWTELHKQNRYHIKYPMEEVVQFLFHNFRRDGSERVLDNGCGAGRHIILMAKEGIQPFGIDYSSSGIEYTKKILKDAGYEHYIGNIKNASCDRLPFDDAFFDGIINMGVLYYLAESEIVKAVDEMYRVMKPGGKLLLYARTIEDYRYTDIDDLGSRTGIISEKDENKCAKSENGMRMHFFSKNEIEQLMVNWKNVIIDKIIKTHNNESYADVNYIIYANR